MVINNLNNLKMKSTIAYLLLMLIAISFSVCSKHQKKERYWKGLIGAYYGNPDFTKPKEAEVFTDFYHRWNEDTGHGSGWSAVYVGYLIAPTGDEVTINIATNTQASIEIAGNKKITAKGKNGSASLQLHMTKDKKYQVKFWFVYSNVDSAFYKVTWHWKNHKAEVIPLENYVFDSDQSSAWNYLPEPDPAKIDFGKFKHVDSKNIIIFDKPGRFAGWPANNGIWHWGDEIVVSFTAGYYLASEHHHSIDESKPSETVQSRSTDGGETWTFEGSLKIVRKPKQNEIINFENPNLAVRCRGNEFLISYDRAKSWIGPFNFPKFSYDKLTSRTDFVPVYKNTCYFFLSFEDKSVQARLEDKAFTAITRDGGKTFSKLGEMCPEDNYRAVMPSTVMVGVDHFITTLRRRWDEPMGDVKPPLTHNWIDAYESIDGCKSWHLLRKVAETDMGKNNGNPPCLIRLNDGRLVVTYGYRAVPYGIRAKLSNDNGKSWSEEIHLRDDARSFDFGYTRTVQRSDGKIVTIYYYTTENKIEQHISATIWNPDKNNKN